MNIIHELDGSFNIKNNPELQKPKIYCPEYIGNRKWGIAPQILQDLKDGYSFIHKSHDDAWHDKHYSGKIQPIEVMQSNMGKEEFIGFLKGNIIKYILRMGRKDEPTKETDKVIRYATWLKQVQLGKQINPRE